MSLPCLIRPTPPRTRPTAAVEPREPASLVTLLDWTYRRQRADLWSGKSLHGMGGGDSDIAEMLPSLRNNATALSATGLMGSVIPSTSQQQRPALHADAELIHDLLVAMSVDGVGAQLLVLNALQDRVPPWQVRQELGPVLKDGRPEVREAEKITIRYASRNQRCFSVLYCPIEPYPGDAWVEMVRGEYRLWYAALQKLGARLPPSQLRRWRLTGLGADPAPWETTAAIRPASPGSPA